MTHTSKLNFQSKQILFKSPAIWVIWCIWPMDDLWDDNDPRWPFQVYHITMNTLKCLKNIKGGHEQIQVGSNKSRVFTTTYWNSIYLRAKFKMTFRHQSVQFKLDYWYTKNDVPFNIQYDSSCMSHIVEIFQPSSTQYP